jgi:hypothetical protein
MIAAFVLGFVAQSVKISVDTTVQRGIDDAFRGRVFSLYDTLFNVTFVSAATLTALALPNDGKTVVGVLAISFGYLLVGLWYATRRGTELPEEAELLEGPAHPPAPIRRPAAVPVPPTL